MKHYEWILFDADETLFHFDAFSGLQRMFAQFDVEFSTDDYLAYQEVNKPLWIDYQNGDISAQELQHQRFSSWAQQLRVSPKDLNSAFLSAMADICKPLEGANSLVSALYGKVKLGIITNGFTELQQIRLERLGLREYFDILVISEQVGFAKPHQAIFEHALSIMGQPERNKVLMVGDNPDTDILGGINAGFETCWLNVHENPTPEAITPGYQVSSLPELEQLLFAEQDK